MTDALATPAATTSVLRPDLRALLFDALRPPAGYELDQAVGTTFTLDLQALVAATVAFGAFDTERPDGMPLADPVAIFEAVRRAGPRTTIFCQAGEIGVPAFRSEFAFIERSIVQVKAPRPGGVFHPKVWVARFNPTEESKADEAAAGRTTVSRYRMLCMSRNLTFDRSWDTILQLDGTPTTTRPYLNRPLADFIRELPRLAIDNTGERAAAVAQLADEIESVKWEPLPDPLRLEWFWPMGLGRRDPPPMEKYRDGAMVVVSPFVKKGLLEKMLRGHPHSVLVTRESTLRSLGAEGIAAAARVCVLRSGLVAESDDEARPIEEPLDSESKLTDLHAKFYAIDSLEGVRIWTGSANATDAGFGANVEFLAQLRSKDRGHTVATLLEPGPANRPTFGSMLEDWTVDREPEPETEAEKSDRTLTDIARALSGLAWRATARRTGEDQFAVVLSARGDGLPIKQPGLEVWVRPLGSEASRVLVNQRSRRIRATFDSGFARLSAFFVLDLRLRDGREVAATRSVLIPAILDGAPSDRLARLQASDLGPAGFHRLMLLLLGTLDPTGGDLTELNNHGQWTQAATGSPLDREALLEPLLRTLARAPARLERINDLVNEWRKTPEGSDLLPEGWAELWAAVSSARPRIRR
jgi:hypothetical protein